VADGKKIPMKSAARTELYIIITLHHPAPPTPGIIRLGTWLGAIVCYAESFEIFCSLVNELDKDDASSVATLQDVYKDSYKLNMLKTDLGHIRENFTFVCSL
jgi:hypothetical protein